MDRFGNHDGHLLKSNETFPAYKGQPASVRVDQPETSETDVCLCTHNIGAYIVTNIISGVPVHNYSITGSIPRRTTRLRKDSVTEICFPVLGVWVFANVFFFQCCSVQAPTGQGYTTLSLLSNHNIGITLSLHSSTAETYAASPACCYNGIRSHQGLFMPFRYSIHKENSKRVWDVGFNLHRMKVIQV